MSPHSLPAAPAERSHLPAPVGSHRRLTRRSTSPRSALLLASLLTTASLLALTAAPALAATQTLTLSKSGTGTGTLTSSPEGIACGATCAAEFETGASVTLTAVPESASRFAAWNGCDSEPGPAQCEVTMSAAESVKAEFVLAPPSRAFDTRLTGLIGGPTGIAIDPSGDAWVLSFLNEPFHAAFYISEFEPDGSLTFQETPPHYQGNREAESLAFNDASGLLYLAGGGEPAYIYSTGASGLSFDSNIDLAARSVAVDNSGGATDGDIYGLNEGAAGVVNRLDAANEPAPFSASAPYIGGEHNNQITGSPEGHFAGSEGEMAVDAEGRLYVSEAFAPGLSNHGHNGVYEFASSGAFLRKFTGAGAPGEFRPNGVAVDPTNSDVLISSGESGAGVVDVFDPAGRYLEQLTGTSPTEPFGDVNGGIAVNAQGYLYVSDDANGVVDEFAPSDVSLPDLSYGPVKAPTRHSGTLTATVKPGKVGEEVIACRFEYGEEAGDYSLGSKSCLDSAGNQVGTPANPIESETEVHAEISGLTPETTYHYRLVAENSKERARYGHDATYTPHNVAQLSTAPATGVETEAATLNGSLDPEGHDTTYHFEYTTKSDFKAHGYAAATRLPDVDAGAGSTQVDLSQAATGLVPDTAYVYRLLASNEFGSTIGEENQEFTTFQPPTIESVSSSDVTATSADLEARINPQGLPAGLEAECSFEYGPTTAYGRTAPCPEKLTGTTGRSVKVEIEGLQRGVPYHFRVLAKSRWGTVTSEDQSFEFFPPTCPNSAVRQQTGTVYLPDCRAYELVSPATANGTLFFPGGPNTGQATNPSRLSFTGAFSSVPGENVIDTDSDLYVATRTDTGWETHYVGLPGNESSCAGGPPTSPLTHLDWGGEIQNSVLTDPAMDSFLDWNDGVGINCILGTQGLGDTGVQIDRPSVAPYLWSSTGAALGRLPTDLASTPGATAASECQVLNGNGEPGSSIGAQVPACSGEVTASGDLDHLIFSSTTASFTTGGLTEAPGSAYDNDIATGAVKKISVLKNGENIPSGGTAEYIRFPYVSTDDSHILMSTGSAPPLCFKGAREEPPCPTFTDFPLHLYMSIDDGLAIEIAPGHTVNYVGTAEEGAKVFFTSEEHLTGEDEDHGGASLYMWSQKGEEETPSHPLTLISKGDDEGKPGEPGNTDACNPTPARYSRPAGGAGEPPIEAEVPWTTKCGVLPYSGYTYSTALGGVGGNGISDTPIASKNGDIYFYSPEQLDGDRGVLNQQNLYDYRDGRVQYVTTLAPTEHCVGRQIHSSILFDCSESSIARLEVTPDDTHMAFATTDRLTSYENAGHLEMYSYTPSTGDIVCDSCNPDGQPATADIEASQDGLFLTDDGRTFFSTTEALVPQDTNKGEDVYEFVDGRPQLITPGTGTAALKGETYVSANEAPGLIGVSANGTDVYFSTFDTLLAEDHNGDFMKFYDARSDGGFPQPPPAQPCAAAEECHGPGTEPSELPTQGTAATLTGGNAIPGSHAKHHKKHNRAKRHKRHHSRAAHHSRGGKK